MLSHLRLFFKMCFFKPVKAIFFCRNKNENQPQDYRDPKSWWFPIPKVSRPLSSEQKQRDCVTENSMNISQETLGDFFLFFKSCISEKLPDILAVLLSHVSTCILISSKLISLHINLKKILINNTTKYVDS